MTLRRIPVRGWRRCVHAAASFESPGEYAAAILMDDSPRILWWVRNDPSLFRIPSPAGYFNPDFLYRARTPNGETMGIMEIKGGVFWNGEGSEPRVKAQAAREWVRTVNATDPEVRWEFAVILEEDAKDASSLEELRQIAQLAEP